MRDRFRNNLKFLAEKMPDLHPSIVKNLDVAMPKSHYEVFMSLLTAWPSTRLRGCYETLSRLKRKRHRVLISIARKVTEEDLHASVSDCDAIVSRCVHTFTVHSVYSGNIVYSRIKTPIVKCPSCSCPDFVFETRTKDLHCCAHCNVTFWPNKK